MRALEEHTRSDPHHEVCGFVYADRYVPLNNVSRDPASFNADPGKVAWALNRFGEPDAIFHSHTNGSSKPSVRDIQLSYYYCNSTILIGVLAPAGFSLFAWRSAAQTL